MGEPDHRVLEDLKEFESAFLALLGPGRDDDMLRRLRSILFRIQSSDSYLNEKKGKLDRAAEMWFSARRWEKYPGGEAALRVFVLGNLQSVRHEFARLHGLQ